MSPTRTGTLALAAALLAAGCAPRHAPAPAPAAVPAAVTLKAAYRGAFLIGAALNGAQFSGQDSGETALLAAQFNSISPENVLKWERVHPRLGTYAFDAGDRYVTFGERYRMFIVGHVLVWHNQTPRWVFEDSGGAPVSRDTLIARMRDHILTVAGRYRGRIGGWDVVNEAVDEDGSLRATPWQRIIGDDYVALAFRFAHEADPGAELYYNDYSLANAAKRDGVVRLIRRLQAEGVPVAGVGMQNHDGLDYPPLASLDSSIAAFAALGVKVMVTELDVDVLPRAMRQTGADVSQRAAARPDLNPYVAGLPDSVQHALARRYGELFGVFYRHRDAISRVTFWGVTDKDSWKNNWPVPGRTNYPLLFDRSGRPKPAFEAVIAVPGRAAAGP
jgi:endo-1,4-beta-xylanase